MTTRVTAHDDLGPDESVDITDNYVLIRDGSAYIANITVHNVKDGTATHVITVKGCRR